MYYSLSLRWTQVVLALEAGRVIQKVVATADPVRSCMIEMDKDSRWIKGTVLVILFPRGWFYNMVMLCGSGAWWFCKV